MAVLDSLKEIYGKIEDKYYSFLDWVEEKGLPVYKVVDAIEASNIPSFPIAIIFALLILGLIFIGISSMFGGGVLEITVSNTSDTLISGATITVYAEGKLITEGETENGIVSLQIPLNTEIEITVIKTGFNEKTINYLAEESNESVNILISEEITEQYKTINLLTAGTNRVLEEEIEVEFYCTGSSFSETKQTSTGKIELIVPSDCDSLVARAYGDYSITDETIYLSSETRFDLYLEKNEVATGSVIVTISNNQGETIPGIDISLYTVTSDNTSGSAFESKQTSSAGTAMFSGVPSGRYYVIAFDRSGNYGEYDGIEDGVIQEVYSEGVTDFSAVLNDKIVGKIKLLIKNKITEEPISNALVSLSKNQTKLIELFTNEQGQIEFSIAEDIEYDISIDKTGFILKSLKTTPSNDYKQVLLEEATLENSQSLLVTVVDAQTKPIENVRVKLKQNSDGTQIGAELVTGLDGKVIFERLEDGAYYAYALKPGYGDKVSDTVNVNSREVNTVQIKLPIGSGKLSASVVDDQGNIITGATIKAVDFYSKQTLKEEVTDADGKKDITLRADKKVFLIVSSAEYVSTITTPIQIQKDVSLEKSIVLTKNIQSFGVELEGLFVNGEKVSNSLSAGTNYTAKLKLLLPNNASFEEAGIHIRTGKEENDLLEKDNLYISEVRSAYNSLLQGTTYTPPVGQATDFQHLTTGNAKWSNIIFTNVTAGVYEIEADIQVKAEARIGSPIDIWYRGYGKSGGYLRAPNDAVLGTTSGKSEKEGLYANALKRSYSVGPSSLCNDEFCTSFSITNLREGLSSNIIEEYSAEIGNNYKLSFELASVSKSPFSATQLMVKDKTSGISIENYKITTALGETREGQATGSELSVAVGDISEDSVIKGELVFETKKTGIIPLEFSIVSGTGTTTEVYKKTIRVNVLPAEKLSFDVLPKIIVPFINNNLLVKVSDDNGSVSISNAFVSIIKDGIIVASGETDSEGIFAYQLLAPTDGSTIGIKVEKIGYQPIEKELKVTPNVLLTQPAEIKLTMTVGGAEFKNIDAELLNYSQINFAVENMEISSDFQDFATFNFSSPLEGATITPDGNASITGTIRLGERGQLISEPLKLKGAIQLTVSNPIFDKTWLALIPIELTIGFGDEVDDTECFNVFPAEWKIFGSTTDTQKLNVTLSNSCKVDGQKITLRNVSARVISGNDNLLGTIRANTTPIDGVFREIMNLLEKDSDETIAFEFKPQNIVSGAGEAKIELEAIHLTASGEQKLTKKIDVSININNLNECVEILSNRDIVIESCPYNTGYGNYSNGSYFDNYSNSRYASSDPYASQYGYGTGNPSYIGTEYQQNSIYGDSYYDYQGSNYPNTYYQQPYLNNGYGAQGNTGYSGYQGNTGYSGYPSNTGYSGYQGNTGYPNNTGVSGMNSQWNNSWKCGEGGFSVRNNCASTVDLSFDPQPGITVAEKTVSIEPGEETEVIVEPTNFFGMYELIVKAKASESTEKAIGLATLKVNITNEATKNYRDCISVSPSSTLSFNNFFGKPVELKVINSCYAEGVVLEFSNNTIMFSGTSVASPTDAGSGFREMIESHSLLDEQFVTGSDGKVAQVLTFELVKALKEYQNKAPEAKFFETNKFANIGNLRYFASSGYYSVMGRTNLRVNLRPPHGGSKTISFPMTIKDYWPMLEYADRLTDELQTQGDPKLNPCDCLNLNSLDFSKFNYIEPTTGYKTRENGVLFKLGDKGGCATADKLQGINPMSFKSENGLILNISADPLGPTHELVLSFDTTQWNGTKTEFNVQPTGKVTRINPTGTAMCTLPIKINVKGTDGIIEPDTPGPSTDPQGVGLTTACGDDAETGTEAFKKYGLQHIHYEWNLNTGGELAIKENACDAQKVTGEEMEDLGLMVDYDTAPWFCDAVQLTTEIEKKTERIQKVTDKISGIGTCSNGFDCANPESKTSLELFRYVLTQHKETGYFTGTDGKVLSIVDSIDTDKHAFSASVEKLITQLKDKSTGDNAQNKKIISETVKVSSDLLRLMESEKELEGMDVVLELDNLPEAVAKVGAKEIKANYFVLPLREFRDFDKALNENEICMAENAVNCTINGQEITVDFLQKLLEGTWKITAKNTEMSDYVKELVMKEGNWTIGPQTGYDNFWVFYKHNIVPSVYLMEETFSAKLGDTFAPAEKLDFKTNNVEAGQSTVKIKKYFGTKENEKTEITIDKTKDLSAIDETNSGSTKYAENVLFKMPIDGSTKWGTGFTGTDKAVPMLYFNYANLEVNYQAQANGNTNRALTYQSTFANTQAGKVVTVTNTAFTFAPSEPIKLTAEFNKNSENKSAGFLFQLHKTGSTTEFLPTTWEVTKSILSSRPVGTTLTAGTHSLSLLCPELVANRGDNYSGFITADKVSGKTEMKTVLFIPAKTSSNKTHELNLVCLKDTGSVKAEYLINNAKKTLGNLTARGIINLTNKISDSTQNTYKTQYNLANLLDLINEEKICIASKSSKLDLLWNDKEFWE